MIPTRSPNFLDIVQICKKNFPSFFNVSNTILDRKSWSKNVIHLFEKTDEEAIKKQQKLLSLWRIKPNPLLKDNELIIRAVFRALKNPKLTLSERYYICQFLFNQTGKGSEITKQTFSPLSRTDEQYTALINQYLFNKSRPREEAQQRQILIELKHAIWACREEYIVEKLPDIINIEDTELTDCAMMLIHDANLQQLAQQEITKIQNLEVIEFGVIKPSLVFFINLASHIPSNTKLVDSIIEILLSFSNERHFSLSMLAMNALINYLPKTQRVDFYRRARLWMWQAIIQFDTYSQTVFTLCKILEPKTSSSTLYHSLQNEIDIRSIDSDTEEPLLKIVEIFIDKIDTQVADYLWKSFFEKRIADKIMQPQEFWIILYSFVNKLSDHYFRDLIKQYQEYLEITPPENADTDDEEEEDEENDVIELYTQEELTDKLSGILISCAARLSVDDTIFFCSKLLEKADANADSVQSMIALIRALRAKDMKQEASAFLTKFLQKIPGYRLSQQLLTITDPHQTQIILDRLTSIYEFSRPPADLDSEKLSLVLKKLIHIIVLEISKEQKNAVHTNFILFRIFKELPLNKNHLIDKELIKSFIDALITQGYVLPIFPMLAEEDSRYYLNELIKQFASIRTHISNEIFDVLKENTSLLDANQLETIITSIIRLCREHNHLAKHHTIMNSSSIFMASQNYRPGQFLSLPHLFGALAILDDCYAQHSMLIGHKRSRDCDEEKEATNPKQGRMIF